MKLLPSVFLFLSSLAAIGQSLTDDLVAYWPLDELNGTSTPDVVNGYDMEAVNLGATDFVSGQVGNAVMLSGGDNTLLERLHAEGDALPIHQYDQFTISMWTKIKGTGQNDLRVFSEGSTNSNDPLFNLGTANNGANDTLDIYIRAAGSGTINHPKSIAEPLDDTWHHIAWVQIEETGSLYIDGELDSEYETASPTERFGTNLNTTSIGGIRRANPSHWVTGLIDDVALWNRALGPLEVSELASGASLLGGGSDPDVSVSQVFDFGRVPAVPIQTGTIKVRNNGDINDLVLSNIGFSGGDSSHFAVAQAPESIPPGEEGVIEISFDASNTSGGFSSLLTMETNDPDAEEQNISIHVTASVLSEAGPAAHYKLDGQMPDNEVFDSSGFGRHGAAESDGGIFSTMQEALVPGGDSVAISGGGQVRIPGANFPDFESFTVSLWIQFDDFPETPTSVFGKGGESPDFALLQTNGVLQWFAVDLNTPQFEASDSPLQTGRTYHLVFRYDSGTDSPTATVFLDGVSVAEEPNLDPLPSGSGDLFFGAYNRALGLTGRLDDIQLYDKPLSDADIASLFSSPGSTIGNDGDIDSDGDGLSDLQESNLGTNALSTDSDDDGLSDGEEINQHQTNPLLADSDGDGFSDRFEISRESDPNDINSTPDLGGGDPDPDLVAYLPLDEAQNGVTPDIVSGLDFDLVNLGAGDLVVGAIGSALHFDAAGQSLVERIHSEGDPLPINQYEAFSISLWVKADGNGQSDLRAFSESNADGDGTPLFNIGTDSGGASASVDLYIRGAGDTLNHPKSELEAFDGEWHHICWTQDGPMAILYVDGVADSTDFTTVNPLERFNNGASINATSIGGIRRASPSHWITGDIDEVSLWKRVLVAEEIAILADGQTALAIGGGGETSDDQDGDGQSNDAEAIAGTDPNDSSDFLHITSMSEDANGRSLEWTAKTGKTYVVEFKTDLADADWVTVDTIVGNNETANYVDDNAERLAAAQGFYRIRVNNL